MLIKDLANEEKPRERLLLYGKENISNEELLAIIIRNGTHNLSSKNLAAKVLSKFKKIENLKDANINNLMQIKGMGKVKSIEVLASIELGKRVYETLPSKDIKLNNSKKIYNEFKDLFIGQNQELFYSLYFDSKQKLLDYKLLFKGTLNFTTVHPREIFKEAFLLSASSIVLIHNHPSGDPTPSSPDIDITKQIESISKMMGIYLIDHIIIGKNKYYSFYENSHN